MIKWGFIGCGEVTKTKSGPAFQKVEHSEVVAVMSRDGAKAKAYAKERGIRKWYDDAQELIDDPEVNAIYIATPPSSHATYAIMAMKAGKPAYIEKPMAVTYEECTRINRISKETGVPCFVAYYRRYLPYFQKVKEMVENGSIGNVINVQVRFAQPHVIWITTVKIFLGVYRLILPVAVTSMTSPRIRSTCCKICSAASSKPADIRVTAEGFILPKIR